MSKNKKSSEDSDHMKAAEQLRASMVVEKKKKNDVKQMFHKFFIKIKGKLHLADEMESVMWKHLQATKTDKPEKFEEGVRSFGYKI